MGACFEYLECGKQGCIMYGLNSNKPCWEIEGTLCNHYGIQALRETIPGSKKEDACARSGCFYYKSERRRRSLSMKELSSFANELDDILKWK